jgi:acyl-CoA dehydrogenase
MTTDTQDLLGEQFEQLLRACCPLETVRAIEAGGDPGPLWAEIERSGFLDALRPEADGGAGLGLPDIHGLVERCGRHALPVPFGQTLVARAWLAEAGIAPPDGPIVLATAHDGAAAGGGARCGPVAEGMTASFVLLQRGDRMLLLRAAEGAREAVAPGTGMARFAWPEAAVASAMAMFAATREALPVAAAILAAQLAGTAIQVFETTLRYANDRVQFGRSIGKFQAIQHHVSVMAELAALARGAGRYPFVDGRRFPETVPAAMAKSVASESAAQIAAIAHAVHGAIGITAEYPLQIYTRRLHEWRLCAGSETYWNERIGEATLDAGLGLVEFVRRAGGAAPLE